MTFETPFAGAPAEYNLARMKIKVRPEDGTVKISGLEVTLCYHPEGAYNHIILKKIMLKKCYGEQKSFKMSTEDGGGVQLNQNMKGWKGQENLTSQGRCE